jgi:hypothetical protein
LSKNIASSSHQLPLTTPFENKFQYGFVGWLHPNIEISELVSTYLKHKKGMEEAEQNIRELSEFDLNA